jgi:hypothetical protein
MKTCTKCKLKQTDKSWCEDCRKAYLKKYRESKKEHIKILNKEWREKNKEYCKEVKFQYFRSLKGRLIELNRSASRRAKKRNLSFDLSADFLQQLWNSQKGLCAITRLPLIIPQGTSGKANPFSPSVDRIDPTIGYLRHNVRLTCYAVNCCLHDFGIKVFHRIATAYLKNIILDFSFTPNKKILSPRGRQDKKYRESKKGTVSNLFNQSRRNANALKCKFSLTKQMLHELFVKQNNCCSLTKIPFNLCFFDVCSSNPFRPSVDRINSNKGYTQDNIRIVCVSVNYALNEFGEQIFKQICESYFKCVSLS